jgi:hypothetical protein
LVIRVATVRRNKIRLSSRALKEMQNTRSTSKDILGLEDLISDGSALPGQSTYLLEIDCDAAFEILQ